MRVIIAGNRDFNDYDLLCKEMKRFVENSLLPLTEIVSGTQEGADKLGERWAKENNIKIEPFKPDWNKYGLKAGPIRNEKMAKYADYLILFWDGQIRGNVGKGSRNMMNNMIKQGKQYTVINYRNY